MAANIGYKLLVKKANTHSEQSLSAATSLLAMDILSFNCIWSDRSDISVKAATALATT